MHSTAPDLVIALRAVLDGGGSGLDARNAVVRRARHRIS
jgi:hypothetical protein